MSVVLKLITKGFQDTHIPQGHKKVLKECFKKDLPTTEF